MFHVCPFLFSCVLFEVGSVMVPSRILDYYECWNYSLLATVGLQHLPVRDHALLDLRVDV